MSSTRSCKLPTDSFCYVCGFYISPKQVQHAILPGTKFCTAYKHYFGVPVGDFDKIWAPHVSCGSCRSNLEGWLRGSRKSMPFAIPRIWREPSNHHNDCYFCIVDISKYKSVKNRRNLDYPSIPSSIAPVPHSNDLPVPKPPDQYSTDEESAIKSDSDETFLSEDEEKGPHLLSQSELDDFIRELELPKCKAELVASRFKEWRFLLPSCKITSYRTRNKEFSSFFHTVEKLCYCFKINELFEAIGVPHIAEDWRLFIDSSTRSLKAVLLHNGNMYPSIPVGYSTHLKEDYENVRFLLEKINYTSYKWDICGDFKMLGFILGLQGGFTKYSCFLCLWDSRATDQHYTQKTWPQREHLIPGKHNVIHEALVPREKILLPPLHIKLGLVKQFVKALEPISIAYLHIRKMFPHLSDAKVKGGIFTGPQIRLMLSSQELEQKMTDIERNAWKAFRAVVTGFLGNKKSDNYEEIVASLLEHYRSLGCRMSIKLHYLHSHLEFFRPNLGDVSEEHGERFHQDIETMEKRYQGRCDAAIMGDYIWGLVRSTSDPHKRKCTSSVHF